jgi:hypothetical protein
MYLVFVMSVRIMVNPGLAPLSHLLNILSQCQPFVIANLYTHLLHIPVISPVSPVFTAGNSLIDMVVFNPTLPVFHLHQ